MTVACKCQTAAPGKALHVSLVRTVIYIYCNRVTVDNILYRSPTILCDSCVQMSRTLLTRPVKPLHVSYSRYCNRVTVATYSTDRRLFCVTVECKYQSVMSSGQQDDVISIAKVRDHSPSNFVVHLEIHRRFPSSVIF